MFKWLLGSKRIVLYICLMIIGFFLGYDYVLLTAKSPQVSGTEIVNLEKKYEQLEMSTPEQPEATPYQEEEGGFPEVEEGLPAVQESEAEWDYEIIE